LEKAFKENNVVDIFSFLLLMDKKGRKEISESGMVKEVLE